MPDHMRHRLLGIRSPIHSPLMAVGKGKRLLPVRRHKPPRLLQRRPVMIAQNAHDLSHQRLQPVQQPRRLRRAAAPVHDIPHQNQPPRLVMRHQIPQRLLTRRHPPLRQQRPLPPPLHLIAEVHIRHRQPFLPGMH